MTLRSSTILAALLVLPAGPSLSAQVVRSGNIATCIPGKECSEETIDGRKYLVLELSQTTVKVAILPDSKYNHIAAIVENRTGLTIQLNPADFRIEVAEPKYKRLSYVDPGQAKPGWTKTAKPQSPSVARSFAGSKESDRKNDHDYLQAMKLGPESTTAGEVFFERTSGNSPMSLLLPIGGTIFEFPMKRAK